MAIILQCNPDDVPLDVYRWRMRITTLETMSRPNIPHIHCHENTDIKLLWYYGPIYSFPRELSSDMIDVLVAGSGRLSFGLSNYYHYFRSSYCIAAVDMPLPRNDECMSEAWLTMAKIAKWLTNLITNTPAPQWFSNWIREDRFCDIIQGTTVIATVFYPVCVQNRFVLPLAPSR